MTIINSQYVKGTIIFDTSKKGDGIRGIKRHASWRAVVKEATTGQ